MVTENNPRLAVEVKRALAEAGYVENVAISNDTGIPRTTLNRRLKFGSFTVSELEAISELTGIRVSDLMRRAEEVPA